MKPLQIIRLDGAWNMKAAGEDTFLPAQVPGDIFSDLLRSGRIEDPYFRDNELAVLPLSEREYIYEKTFDLPAQFTERDRVILRFEGIDTLADIELNGQHVAFADNMHRTWEFSVRDLLQERGNVLRVLFHSPTAYIRERYEKRRLDGTSDAMRGFPYLRKAHYMFGWDWGARLPGGGLWRSVSLIACDAARIVSVYIRQRHEGNVVTLCPQAELDLWPEAADLWKDMAVEMQVLDPEGAEAGRGVTKLEAGSGIACTEAAGGTTPSKSGPAGTRLKWDLAPIRLEDPKLWYPAGYGEQPLYTVQTRLCCGGQETDAAAQRIGLRTMGIARHRDEFGESFAHCVNGIEIFAMGADYIPEDHLIARTCRERTFRLLSDARAAHFNCIRVWGGGYYPEDWFYDICDELGLIVWQDFMFACAVYDLSEEFEENIRRELADNIRRLRHHACLGLWCGNNEMEQFVDQGEWVNDPREKADYIKMYEYIFPRILRELDPETFYWPASPSSGGSFDLPNDERRGDVHYWDVWHGGKPFTEYRKFHFRYLSEFGFQAFPPVRTIEAFTLKEDRNIYSYVMEKHQRNAAANGRIAAYMAQTYRYPTSLEVFVYASQLLQAQAIRYGVEHFRRWRGRCMGTVIWQLNDCWPVISWSSIDYFGRWKALHYYAKRFFAPILLSCEEEGMLTQQENPNEEPRQIRRSVRFNVSNETLQEADVTVRWEVRDSLGEVLSEQTAQVSAGPLRAVWLQAEDLPQARLYEDHVFYRLEKEGEILSRGSVLFCPPKYYHFRDPQLQWRLEEDTIIVRAAAYARDVEILNDNEDMVLSDNYFDMEPGEYRVKILRGQPEGIRLRSTYDIR